ncbi:MAG: DUF3298 domain-containing protein [Vicinamibacteria bacterium]
MFRDIVLLALFAAACAPPSSDERSEPTSPRALTFEMKTRENTSQGCVAGSEGCTYIRFDYPAVTAAPEETAIEDISETIESFLMAPIRPDAPPSNANALMEQFLADYAAFKAAEPQSEQIWFLERKAFVLRNSPNLLSLSFSERSYLGGAHGIEMFHFTNLDPRTGRRIALDDVLKDGARQKLALLAEARFRESRAIPEGTSLKDAGFTFENDTFALTENFAIRDDGIAFHYNPYDVAPYALGATDILLTFDEIGDVLKPDYVT